MVHNEHPRIPLSREELEEMLLEGLNSGTSIVMDDAEWQRLHDEIEADAYADSIVAISPKSSL